MGFSKLNLVFVYGTLRRGEVNHYLLSGAEFCGLHQTRSIYKMLHLGAYPGVVSGGSAAIKGEVYRINRKHLIQLDRLEAYPRVYTRKLIPTPWGQAWIYLYRGRRYNRSVIPFGSWCGETMCYLPFSLYG